jgi:hypothetical protein
MSNRNGRKIGNVNLIRLKKGLYQVGWWISETKKYKKHRIRVKTLKEAMEVAQILSDELRSGKDYHNPLRPRSRHRIETKDFNMIAYDYAFSFLG